MGQAQASNRRLASGHPHEPSLSQFDAICRRKDDVAHEVRGECQGAWAISWLALHAQDSGRTDFNAAKNTEAVRIALEHVVLLMEAATGRLDGPHSGAHYAVMNGVEEAP